MTSELRRRAVFGFRFIDAPHVGLVVDALLERRCADTEVADAAPVVFTPNVDILVHLDRNDSPRARSLAHRAAYVLADGQPVVWASKLLGEPLQTRLAGSTLVAQLWPRIAAEGRTVLVVAPSDTVAVLVRADHPAACVVVAPMLPAHDDAALDAFAKECVAACGEIVPEFTFVALGYPKLYVLIDELVALWADAPQPPVHLAIGASFEMYYGLRQRSPEWVQRIGMEWFFRFLQEPRRLFRRYFVDDVAFARIVWDARRAKARRRGTHPTMRPAQPIGRVLPGPWRRGQRPGDRDEDYAKTAN